MDTSSERARGGGLLMASEFQIPPPGREFRSTPSNLLPHLATLRYQLLRHYDRKKEAEKRRAKFIDLEFLPYSLNAAKGAVEDFIRVQEGLVREAVLKDESYTGRRHLDDWWKLAYTVDNFVEASVRTQDAMITYWRERYACTLPKGLNEVVKDKKRCRAKLPEPVLRDLDAYWERSGGLVRDYRHLSQHHAIVASEAEAVPGGSRGHVVRCFLPNNPEQTSTRRRKYQDPEVPAYPFLSQHFVYLLAFAYGQTRMMLLPDDPEAAQLVGHQFRVPKLLGAEGDTWYRMVSREEFHEEIERVQRLLDKRKWHQDQPHD